IRNTNSYNTAIGYLALNGAAGGFENTAVGANALLSIGSGTNNIAVGYNAGSALKTTESQNIDIGNNGVDGDNYIIRIGAFQSATYLAGTVYANGVALTSDRNAKENFRPLDPRTVLAKVAALPITEWNYKTSQNLEHMGPMAQDFHAAFGLNGSDDKHISVVDEGGVALAAIQGLNEKLEADNAALKQENNSLAKRLDELEVEVKALSRSRQ
ncbi:MAG TPA: tail fiber domain-containing protein, partial [Candidatus Acidoferrales bacterium]|nr:tail fiber domain-containing protein [Candidatus Acidoferrales bacterium]